MRTNRQFKLCKYISFIIHLPSRASQAGAQFAASVLPLIHPNPQLAYRGGDGVAGRSPPQFLSTLIPSNTPTPTLPPVRSLTVGSHRKYTPSHYQSKSYFFNRNLIGRIFIYLFIFDQITSSQIETERDRPGVLNVYHECMKSMTGQICRRLPWNNHLFDLFEYSALV